MNCARTEAGDKLVLLELYVYLLTKRLFRGLLVFLRGAVDSSYSKHYLPPAATSPI
jgi:hypothetical protein